MSSPLQYIFAAMVLASSAIAVTMESHPHSHHRQMRGLQQAASGEMMKAAAAAGGLAAVGYAASALATSNMSDSVSDVIFNISDVSGDSASSDSSETSSGGSLGDSSKDSSASYYDSASSNSSQSSQVCGGAGGSESSDSSSGFDCCPNGVLEDAFRALVADSNSSTDWSSVYLSVYRRSFIVVANAYSEETEVECTLSPAQFMNTDTWTYVINYLSSTVAVTDDTVYVNEFTFNYDDVLEAAEVAATAPATAAEPELFKRYMDVVMFTYPPLRVEPPLGYGRFENGTKVDVDFPAGELDSFAELWSAVEPPLCGNITNVKNDWFLCE